MTVQVSDALRLVDDLFAALDKPDFEAGAVALEALDVWRRLERERETNGEPLEAVA